MISLNYMSGGNKAWLLSMITIMIIASGGIVFIVGPDDNQNIGDRVRNESVFTLVPGTPDTITPNPSGPNTAPIESPDTNGPTAQPVQTPPLTTPSPTIRPTPMPVETAFPQATPNPTNPTTTPPPLPVVQQPTPSTGPPIPSTPVVGAVRQYPFAVVFECDWQGNRLSLSTKTILSSVVRLCIEAPPLPDNEAPVEVSYLSWFVFTRRPYDDATEPLEPLTQHAVVLGKADPFGRTVLNCPPGVRICRLATDLRDEFFSDDAFLVGRGELVLRFAQQPDTIAGISPVSIYFLLSDTDIVEPLQLAKRVSGSSSNNAIAATANTASQSAAHPIPARTPQQPTGRRRRKQNPFHNNNKAYNAHPPRSVRT